MTERTASAETAFAGAAAPVSARGRWRGTALSLSVAMIAGAVIAAQLAIMRIFAVGSWAHFGSLVVSLAMLGFGIASTVLCIARGFAERHAAGIATVTAILFAPLLAGANLAAQQAPFNAVFIVADPQQKWRLLANFILYLLPFLAGAGFLGAIFIRYRQRFARLYFADLTGAGLCGFLFLAAMYIVPPENLIVVPLLLGLGGAALWLAAQNNRRAGVALVVAAGFTAAVHYGLPGWLGLPKLAVSDYKAIAYARKFPDSTRVYRRVSPFGDLQVYASSYLHFAPGLSDNAAFNLKEVPENSYLGLYIDGEGPGGIIRDLPAKDTAYFTYLPMIYPYLIKSAPDIFVAQFAGGISTAVALRSGARTVTVAENNPAILEAFQTDPALGAFTGHILDNPKVTVVGHEGRLYLKSSGRKYDVVDLSLANSAGLSSPGGFAVVERFAYTKEAMTAYMRALKPGGVLAVTLWNKEEPPKSVLKLYATMAEAARAANARDVANSFFAAANYLSTATVLYKEGGFTAAEVATLRAHTAAISFDEIYYPGMTVDRAQAPALLDAYWDQIFGAATSAAEPPPAAAPTDAATLPATEIGRLAWQYLIAGDWAALGDRYVFDIAPLTDDRPYFSGYVRVKDLPRVVDRLELLQDEWGYLLLWATLGIAVAAALVLLVLPLLFGWRTMVEHFPGKFRIITYFACLGLGYIVIEVGLLAKFVLALSNSTISAAVVVTGMLVSSGLGALVSERAARRVRTPLPQILLAIGAVLMVYAGAVVNALDWIGGFSLPLRVVFCFALILPPAFLMGFPMPMAMTTLARLGKDRMFVWAWGINGLFSVIGAALVPIVATGFGLNTVLAIGGVAYLIAVPAAFAVFMRPAASAAAQPA